MNYENNYLNELDVIRRAEQERTKVIGQFFRDLFQRHESENVPTNPIPAE